MGLSNELQFALALVSETEVDTLDKLITRCQSLDSRIRGTSNAIMASRARMPFEPFRPSASQSSPAPTRESPLGPKPMDLDAVVTKRKALTAEERKRRTSQCLCFYCGEAGHFRTNCNQRPSSGTIAVMNPARAARKDPGVDDDERADDTNQEN